MTDAHFNSSGRLSMWARRAGRLAVVGLIVAATVASLDAEARRLGGGRSLGRQSSSQSSSAMQRQTTPPPSPSNSPSQNSANTSQAAQAQRMQPSPAVSPAPARSRWLGPIAGLAAGLGIAALLFGLIVYLGRNRSVEGEAPSVVTALTVALEDQSEWDDLRSGNRPAAEPGRRLPA